MQQQLGQFDAPDHTWVLQLGDSFNHRGVKHCLQCTIPMVTFCFCIGMCIQSSAVLHTQIESDCHPMCSQAGHVGLDDCTWGSPPSEDSVDAASASAMGLCNVVSRSYCNLHSQ
eukprot:GHUV01014765.1.p1 GENE.GHUV01014765.1~~GHUV01014765.1.p1  ORF type:complete len:114 (+),score=15.14 GHUV01014765.1:306-647(+)